MKPTIVAVVAIMSFLLAVGCSKEGGKVEFCGQTLEAKENYVKCNDAKVIDLSPLKDLKRLQRVVLNGTQVSDLTPLEDLEHLKSLDLSATQVSDITPLKKLKNLDSLWLSKTKVSDLTPLAELKKLKKVALTGTQVSTDQIQSLKKANPGVQVKR